MKTGIAARFEKIALVHCVFVVVIGLGVLIGWWNEIGFLKRGITGSVSMNPVTAICFIILAALIFLESEAPSQKQLIIALSLLVLFIGSFRLMEVVFFLKSHLTQIVFRNKLLQEQSYGKPNMMAPNTAFCLLLVSGSVLTYHIESIKKWSNYMCLICLVIALFSLVGYLYNASEFYNIKSQIPMAFPTALCFFLLSLAIFLFRGENSLLSLFITPYYGSKIARFLMPLIIVIPIVTGKLRLIGEQNGIYSSQFGTALFVLLSICIYTILIYISTISINKSNEELVDEMKKTKQLSDQLYVEQQNHFQRTLLNNKLKQQKELIAATINGQEKEKKQIGMELHDHINQILASTKMYLEVVYSNGDKDLVNKSIEQLSFAMDEIRKLSRSMVLHSLEKGGIYNQIIEMINNLKRAANFQIDIQIDKEAFNAVAPNGEIAIYRIISEQLNNIVKHAKAENVRVIFFKERLSNFLIISDDGMGYAVSGKRQGIGLANISTRAQILDGEMTIDSYPGAGCKLTIQFPISSETLQL